MTPSTADCLRTALQRRAGFLERCTGSSDGSGDRTDCYRLLHGVAEGAPGLTIDRYGELLLIQTWKEALEPGQLESLSALASETLGVPLQPVWNHRGKARAETFDTWHQPGDLPEHPTALEQGLAYSVAPRHRGLDPLLFLDFRAGRRHIRRYCEQHAGAQVLNLFAYTCGIGVAAAAGGAAEVWNVDFAESALAVGEHNVSLNEPSATSQVFMQGDAFVVARQLAGLSVRGRYGKLPKFDKLARRQFDLVILDPPTWAKSPFGVVDLVRDYQSVFKPALLATRPGGSLLVTNHVARVEASTWLESLRRCAAKNRRTVVDMQLITPDEDFPSLDGQPPLKMASLQLGGES